MRNRSITAFAHAGKNVAATLGAGVLVLASILAFKGGEAYLASWELDVMPVLAPVTICEGTIDKATGQCTGRQVTYQGFQQTGARCDGRDAIVSGTMAKARSDARYVRGGQTVYFGDPNGRSRRAFWMPLDQPRHGPTNRPAGVQEWGEWRLEGGCVSAYTTWFSTVQHDVWHGFWKLTTTLGPFPLPRAEVLGDEQDRHQHQR